LPGNTTRSAAPTNPSGEAASSSAIHQWRLPGVAQQT
jgi:hypothetical protein